MAPRTLPIFIIHEGQPQVIAAFFSASRDYVKWQDVKTLPREVTFYGADGSRGAVYVHLLVEKLFAGSSTNRMVQKDVSIEMDFFAINAEDAHRGRDEDGLTRATARHKDLDFTVVLNLGGRTLPNSGSIDGCISCIRASGSPSLHVEVKEEAPGQTLCELCFELPVDDALLKPIEEKDTFSRHVLGWAWCLSENIKKQYREGGFLVGENKLDVGNREARFDFLEEEHALKRLRNKLLPWELLEGRWPSASGEPFFRSEYKAAVAERQMDAFIYDEPTWNSLRFSKHLPFKSLEVATQLGSIGLCNNNLLSYYDDPLLHEHVELHPFLNQMINGAKRERYEAAGTVVIKTYRAGFLLGEDGKEVLSTTPKVPKKLAIDATTFPFAVNELQNTYEEQYLLREGSVAQWLNTLEKKIYRGSVAHPQPSQGEVLEKAALAEFTEGTRGKLTVFAYDFLRDYRPLVPKYVAGANSNEVYNSMWVQKEIDFGAFETVSVPEGRIKSASGQFLAHLGKGVPVSSSRYLNWVHTKVKIEGDSADDTWQAQPYCHRPILVAYELGRNLTNSEMSRLSDAWKENKVDGELCLRFRWCVGGEKEEQVAKLPLPFLDQRCGKKGKHLVALYLTVRQEVSLEVDLVTGGHVDVPIMRNVDLMTLPGTVTIRATTIDALVTYRTDDDTGTTLDGLFSGSPIISIESLTPLEILQKSLAADAQKYDYTTARDGGKLVLSFIPAYGTIFGSGWELALRLVGHHAAGKKGPLYRGKVLELGVTILGEILGRLLKVNSKAATKAAEEVARSMGRPVVTPAVVEVEKLFSADYGGKLGINIGKAAGSYLDKWDNDFHDLEVKIRTTKSPFKRGTEFQKDPRSTDQLVLMRLRKQTWPLKAGKDGFETVQPSSEEVAEAFFLRPVDLPRGGTSPFYYAFGPTGGFLERDDPSPATYSSHELWEQEYFEGLKDYKAMVPDGLTIEQYFGWLTDSTHIARTPFSKSVKEYLTSNASKLLELRRSGGGSAAQATGPLTDSERQELLMLCATEHLWGYLNATFIRCPVCGQEMQLNWGWCPYHPQFDKKIYKRQDKNESGSWKDEFIKDLEDKKGPWRLDWRLFGVEAAGNLSIVDYLKRISLEEPGRLFVHSSEFIVVK